MVLISLINFRSVANVNTNVDKAVSLSFGIVIHFNPRMDLRSQLPDITMINTNTHKHTMGNWKEFVYLLRHSIRLSE